MSTRQTATAAGIVGLLVSATMLVFLWFGVWGIMQIGHTDLAVVLWPSSIMLTVGWRCTVPGIMTTISSVAINCLLYVAIALLLRSLLRWFLKKSVIP
jgi:hypothetical protein